MPQVNEISWTYTSLSFLMVFLLMIISINFFSSYQSSILPCKCKIFSFFFFI